MQDILAAMEFGPDRERYSKAIIGEGEIFRFVRFLFLRLVTLALATAFAAQVGSMHTEHTMSGDHSVTQMVARNTR